MSISVKTEHMTSILFDETRHLILALPFPYQVHGLLQTYLMSRTQTRSWLVATWKSTSGVWTEIMKTLHILCLPKVHTKVIQEGKSQLRTNHQTKIGFPQLDEPNPHNRKEAERGSIPNPQVSCSRKPKVSSDPA